MSLNAFKQKIMNINSYIILSNNLILFKSNFCRSFTNQNSNSISCNRIMNKIKSQLSTLSIQKRISHIKGFTHCISTLKGNLFHKSIINSSIFYSKNTFRQCFYPNLSIITIRNICNIIVIKKLS